MSLQTEILDGLEVRGWDDSIAAVKHVVANALHRLDRSAEVKDTGYFNHSFVPDFVVTWPREQDRTRDVFLRLDTSTAFLSGDLRYLADTRPLLLGLGALDASDGDGVEGSIGAASSDTRVMVTEPAAVERFTESPPSANFTQVLPAALLKGGRGVIREATAGGLAAASEGFFSGARTHEPLIVQEAVPILSDHLDQRQSDRLLNFGRIVWEATGGDPTAFPVPTDLGGVDDAGLRFLLDEAPSDDPGFWRSVGRLITLERLLSIGIREASNLAPFVRANADRLYARALLVKASQRSLDDSGPSWAIESGGLVLRGSDFIAYMAPRRDDLAMKPDEARGLDFEAFRHRTSHEQVETVTIVAGDAKTVTIRSETMFDPATDVVLASVGELPGTVIERVGLIVAGKHLECDFASRVASGHTNAVFDVEALLERGLPMLWPLSDDRDRAEIQELRRVVASVSLPPSLFDDLDPSIQGQ
ncbi:MAG: hypothetical protein QOI95_21 [Acidimicrobiaceae bacterium]|jgi:hypothetical protein